MIHKKKIIIGIIILCMITLLSRNWIMIFKVKNDGYTEKAKFCLEYIEKETWEKNGAENYIYNSDFGDIIVSFDDYTVRSQVFDVREDLLGTVTQKKTGNEALVLEIKIGDSEYLKSENFDLESFYYSDEKTNVFQNPVLYKNHILKPKELSNKISSIDCERLTYNINSFKKIIDYTFPIYYEQVLKLESYKIIGKVIVLIFLAIVCRGLFNKWVRK